MGKESGFTLISAGDMPETVDVDQSPDGFMFSHKGFSIFEILIALFLMAVAIAPMINAFSPAVISTGEEEKMVVFTNQARFTLNRVSNLPFATLNANQADPVNLETLFGSSAEAAKETFSFRGASYTPQVAIASGGGAGLLELSARAGDIALKTLKAEF
ncbi:MAG: hypothetical protein Q8P24_21605 [Desulfobacterales bacterium]|nr:hypothetical protein [Desulfobacterales bacterium]